MAFPGALTPWVELRFFKMVDGLLAPNDGGFLRWSVAGDFSTLQDTFTTSDVTGSGVANANPIELDSDGRPPSGVYLLPTGYGLQVYDSEMVLLYSNPFVEDVGSAFISTSANIQAQTTTVSVSPYIVVATDQTINITFTSGGVIQLPACSLRGTPLIIKNLSGFVQALTPQIGETIDLASGAYSLPIQDTPNYPTITLLSDGVSNWVIQSSHWVS